MRIGVGCFFEVLEYPERCATRYAKRAWAPLAPRTSRASWSRVASHADAKRYLRWKGAYHAHLSAASKATLTFQGGPMGDAEGAAF